MTLSTALAVSFINLRTEFQVGVKLSGFIKSIRAKYDVEFYE
jgi:hypothetical protein